MIPTIGRIVHYVLSREDADAIARHVTSSRTINHGNIVAEGEIVPMMIVRVWGEEEDSCINGQLFVDGNFSLWLTSVMPNHLENEPGTWHWPPISLPTVSGESTKNVQPSKPAEAVTKS